MLLKINLHFNLKISITQQTTQLKHLSYLQFMSKLPKNILYYLKQYQSKMKGNNSLSLNAIKTSIQNFNKERCDDIHLRGIQIYPYENQDGIQNDLLHIIRIKGRKDSYYQNRILKFYILFFDTYPKEPPQIIAGDCYDQTAKKQKRFLHINVGEGGHLCIGSNQTDKQYFDYTTLRDILAQLQNTIYFPNIVSSFNSQLFTAYNNKGDNSSYYKLLNAQAKLLQLNQSDSEQQIEQICG